MTNKKNVKELKGILCMVRTIVSCSRVKMFREEKDRQNASRERCLEQQ